MNITFVSTAPSLTIGSLTWSSIGASVTVNTADLKAYERANIEYEYSIGNLISVPKLLNGSISATEDNVSPTALGGDVRATVSGGNVVLSAPGVPSILSSVAYTPKTSITASDNVVLEGGAKASVTTLANYFRPDFTLVSSDMTSLPQGSTFSRSSAAYAQDINFSPVAFAANSPRLTRRGLFSSDMAISANLFSNPTSPATQSVTLASGTHTLQVWGTAKITVSGPGGAVGEANPGEALTFTASAGSHTFTLVGDATHIQLKAEAFPSQFSIGAVAAESCVIPTPADWPTHTEHALFLSGMLRQIGVAQSATLSWPDGSYVRAKRTVLGKWQLEYTVDGVTLAGPVSDAVFPGSGADVLLLIDDREARLWCNGTLVASITVPRPISGSYSFVAHEWRSFVYSASAYRTLSSAKLKLRPASHYKLPPLVPHNPGLITRKVQSAWGKKYARMTCAVDGTLDIFLNYNQEGFAVGQNVLISFWDGGPVGGVNPSGQTYAVASQQPGTGTPDRRVRLTVPGTVANSTIVRGELVTVSVGYQASNVHVVNSSVGQSLLMNLNLAVGDTVRFFDLSQGMTHGGCNLSGLTLTYTSAGRLSGATGATGLVTIFGGRVKVEVTRVASSKRPCVIDLDAYSATNETESLPPYNPTTNVLSASGTYDPLSTATTMKATNGANTPNANVDMLIVGRTKARHKNAYITGGNVFPAKIGSVFFTGGVYSTPPIGVQDHSGQDVYFEGVRLDNAGGARREADLWYIRSTNDRRPTYRKTLFNCEGFNTGGSQGTLHSDAIQITGATYNPEYALSLDRVHFAGTYQTVGFLAGQMAYASASDDAIYGKYRRTFRWLSDVQASSPKSEPNIGYLSLWWIDYTVGPNGFGFGGGNAPMPIHFQNFYSAPTQVKVTFDSLFYRATGSSQFVQNCFDSVTGAQQVVNMTLLPDGQSGKLPHGIGGKGLLRFGYIPDGLWPSNHEDSGGLCVPGMGYQSIIAPFADGYFAGSSQIPMSYRRNMPVDFDWQSSGISGTTVTLHLVNPDPLNPIVSLKVYRSVVPPGVSSGFEAYELPESNIPADKILTTISSDPFNGFASTSITDTLASGNGAYYRIGTIRADGSEAISTMWNIRSA